MNSTVKRGRARRLILVAVLMSAIGFGVTVPLAANAGTANSSNGNYTDNGIGYFNRATITTTVGKATASTTVGTRNGSSAPGGWMGFRARLFSSGGSLIQESVTQYNGGPSFQASIGTSRNAGGSWYSYGVTYGWNGSGYNAHFTFTSPNQTS